MSYSKFKKEHEISKTSSKSGAIGRRLFASFLCIMIVAASSVVAPKDAEAAMKLSDNEMYVNITTTKTLTVKNAGGKKVKWSSSNPFCCSVSKGKVKALRYGTSQITATCGGQTFRCKVTVPDKHRTIYLNKYSKKIKDGKSFQLIAYGTNQIFFHSQNTNIATVDSKGKVKGVGPGTTYIFAKKGTGFAKCKVKVTTGAKPKGTPKALKNKKAVAIRRYTSKWKCTFGSITRTKGKSFYLAIANLDKNKVKEIKWYTADEKVASVKAHGKYSAVCKTIAKGSAQVSAVVTYKTGKKTTYVNTVHVSNPSVNKVVNCFTSSAGKNRAQYVRFTGLSSYSKVKYKVPKKSKAATIKVINNKVKITGKRNGHGTIKASVDGKSYKIKFYVCTPKFSSITKIIAKGKTTKLSVSGIGKLDPIYTMRDTKVASVSVDGVIKGKKGGVTYVDVQIGSMTFSKRVEVASKGMKTIIKRAKYIVNNWTYSQALRMNDGYYDCSALVWKGYQAYNNYQLKLGASKWALPAASLYDYLRNKGQVVYYGYTKLDDLHPGDLFFYGDYQSACMYTTPGGTLDIYHVAIYAGNGRVVEKGNPRFNYNNLDHIVGVGRVVDYK